MKFDKPDDAIEITVPPFAGKMLVEIVFVSEVSTRTYAREFEGKLSESQPYRAIVPRRKTEPHKKAMEG